MAKFKLIYADYPWPFRTRGGVDVAYQRIKAGAPLEKYNLLQTAKAKTLSNMGFVSYSTMSVEELAMLPIHLIADEEAVFVLWTVETRVKEAIWMVENYGVDNDPAFKKRPFEFISFAFTWVKPVAKFYQAHGPITLPEGNKLFTMGTGYWTRCNPEVALLFRRKGAKRVSAGVRELIVSPNIKHSKKPIETYDRLKELFGDDINCVELFARNYHPDPRWVSLGSEVGPFDKRPLVGYDIKDTLPLLAKADDINHYYKLYHEFASNNQPRPELIPDWYHKGYNSFDEYLVTEKKISPALLMPIRHPVRPINQNGQLFLESCAKDEEAA